MLFAALLVLWIFCDDSGEKYASFVNKTAVPHQKKAADVAKAAIIGCSQSGLALCVLFGAEMLTGYLQITSAIVCVLAVVSHFLPARKFIIVAFSAVEACGLVLVAVYCFCGGKVMYFAGAALFLIGNIVGPRSLSKVTENLFTQQLEEISDMVITISATLLEVILIVIRIFSQAAAWVTLLCIVILAAIFVIFGV